MSTTDIIKKSVLEGFSGNDLTLTGIFVTLIIAFALALYIHLIYKMVTRNTFYYKNFGTSMVVIAVITAGIVLAMQSSLVISIGMVGALSIVRFRTAVKDPLDLLFLFWAIGIGIICGAGLYEVALVVSLMATIGVLLFDWMPVRSGSCTLVVNALEQTPEEEITGVVKGYSKWHKVRSQVQSSDGLDLILELSLSGDRQAMIRKLREIPGVEQVSLLENDADTRK